MFGKDAATGGAGHLDDGDNSGGNLSAHHINNFSDHEDLRFVLSNGITLCDSCHNPNKIGSFHNIYGTHNNNLS